MFFMCLMDKKSHPSGILYGRGVINYVWFSKMGTHSHANNMRTYFHTFQKATYETPELLILVAIYPCAHVGATLCNSPR